jgi:competence/damage-inducible protein CinA-like protein
LAGAGVRAIVVSVGDELLLGHAVDTNASWVSSRLARLGVRVQEHVTVGDQEEDIRTALMRCIRMADLVIVGGGLGPTPDDRTRAAVAGVTGVPLIEDVTILERLEERFRSGGFESLPPSNRRQALVPEGGEALSNALGTAAGLSLEVEGTWIVVLPGVPREFHAIFDGEVESRILNRFSGRLDPVQELRIHTTGISESVLCDDLERVLPADRGPVSVAYYPDLRGVTVVLTALGAEAAEGNRWLAHLGQAIDPVVSRYRYASKEGDLVEAVAVELLARGWTLAAAESCTGGLIAKRVTDRAGSSQYFLGGVVAYDDGIKVAQLGVPTDLLERHGAVSEEVACRMAEGVRQAFGADVGLGVTGIAGPGGGSADKPVGTVWYAVAIDGETRAEHRRFSGEREAVRERSAQACLALVHRMLPE